MRVIAGSARGRPLRAAEGTRPTADLIKGAIFSMLEALAYKRGFEPDAEGVMAAAQAWPRALDLFAGSGALGIEALSRGALNAEFVERDRQAVKVIEANLRATGLQDRARLDATSVQAALQRVQGPFDLVFVDPPYGDAAGLQEALSLLGALDTLTGTSVVIVEQASEAEAVAAIGPLSLVTTRRHGGTRISLYGTPASEC